jgi:hypothetical protein
MNYEQWIQIYEQMKEVLLRDQTLTHIDLSFHIKPVTSEAKRARISIRTFKEKTK